MKGQDFTPTTRAHRRWAVRFSRELWAAFVSHHNISYDAAWRLAEKMAGPPPKAKASPA